MVIWFCCFALLYFGLKLISKEFRFLAIFRGFRKTEIQLNSVIALLHELQETLQAGLVPERSRWESVKNLGAPWGSLTFESIEGIRSRGGAVLPTLIRLRGLAEEQLGAIRTARSRSAQALAQAMICGFLVPVFGLGLYVILPSLNQQAPVWLGVCGAAALLTGLGALWLFTLSQNARWGGLKAEQRSWILAAQCAGERLLAIVRSGTTPDLAWVQVCLLLDHEAPGLAALWGRQLWQEAQTQLPPKGLLGALTLSGRSIKKTIQVSLMDGHPCLERIEGSLRTMKAEIHAEVDRELQLLGTRALRPLFFCVAPALLGLLGSALWLEWLQNVGSWGEI